MELENKVSLVTGAGQGIGEGIAKVLASHGSKVMIVDLNGKSAKKVAKERGGQWIKGRSEEHTSELQ